MNLYRDFSWFRMLSEKRYGPFRLLVVFLIALIVLKALGVGCDNFSCSLRAVAFGFQLFLGALCFIVVGALANSVICNDGRCSSPRVFYWLLLGQALAFVYVYLRSAINHAGLKVPITSSELFFLVVLSLTLLIIRGKCFLPQRLLTTRRGGWIAAELAVLAAVCVVTADRELPRVVLLSSDPDQHAFFGKQILVLGAIPAWWEAESFKYPAGSGVLTFLWSSLGFLDPKNSLAALPTLQSFFAALLLGECVAVVRRRQIERVSILLFALGLNGAGFVLSYYDIHAHFEGTARLMSIGAASLLFTSALRQLYGNKRFSRSFYIATALALFMLGCLNPVSVLGGVIVAGVLFVIVSIADRRMWALGLVGFIGLPALFLDPYYQSLVAAGSVGHPVIEVNGNLRQIGFRELVLSIWRPSTWWLINLTDRLGMLLAAKQLPIFFLLTLIFSVPIVTCYDRILIRIKVFLFVATVLVFATVISLALLPLESDRNLYLIPPYLVFTIGQYKVLALIGLALLAIHAFCVKERNIFKQIVLMILLVVITAIIVRSTQVHSLKPRYQYCGSLGCAAEADILALEKFRVILTEKIENSTLDVRNSKVLLPNSMEDFGREFWIFPVAGARLAPFVLPVLPAFFYGYGDPSFSTTNYRDKVCKNFDRKWLKERGVRFVFLPADRTRACISGMEDMISSEIVIISEKDSFVIELR